MFIDLKGFTTLSEDMRCEDVVTLLNRFFSYMIPIIFKNKGTLDKLLGDGIMAVFGSPIEDTESRLNAVKAALEMFNVLNTLNKDIQQSINNNTWGKDSLDIRDNINIEMLDTSYMIPNEQNNNNIANAIEMVSSIEMRRDVEIKNPLKMTIGINYGSWLRVLWDQNSTLTTQLSEMWSTLPNVFNL